MIDITPFLQILPLFMVVLISPGPCLFIVSKLTLAQGRRAGIVCGAGMALAEVILAGLSLWGLGLFFQKAPSLVGAVKLVGGLYLMYLGWQFIRATLPHRRAQIKQTCEMARSSGGRGPFWLGFAVNISNPAVVAFFTSAFALTVREDMSVPTKLAASLLSGLAVFLWFLFVAGTLSLPRVRAAYQAASLWIDRFAGLLLVLYGVRLALPDSVFA